MKFLKSFLFIAVIVATTQAQQSYNDFYEAQYMIDQIKSNTGELSFSMFLNPETYKYSFDNMAQSLMYQYQPDQLTDAQKAAVDYVLTTKNSYKDDVYNCILNTVNNAKSWMNGNNTQYGPIFLQLMNDYIEATKAGMQTVAGRPECGTYDPSNFKSGIMMNASGLFNGGSTGTKITDNLMYMDSMNQMNSGYFTDVTSIFYSLLSDSDPMAFIKYKESSLIYPRRDFINSYLVNLANQFVAMITTDYNNRVANIKAAIAAIPAIAQNYQCYGNPTY